MGKLNQITRLSGGQETDFLATSAISKDGIQFTLFIATSDQQKSGPFKDQRYSWTWELRDAHGKWVTGDSNAFEAPSEGFHGEGLYIGLLHAIGQDLVSFGATVLVISDTYIVDQLNTSAEKRRKSGYKKSGTRKPLADADSLMKLDELVEAKKLSLSAERPEGGSENFYKLAGLKQTASTLSRNIGRKPGDWDL